MTPGSPPESPGAPRRALAWGAALILAVAVAALVVITRGESDAPAPAGGASPTDPPATPVVPVPAAAPGAPAPESPDGTPRAKDWNDVPVSARVSDLGPPLARSVYDGLQAARAALEPCFDADAKDAEAHPRAPEQEDAWGPAILTLQMEGRPGEIIVVNAPLQTLGTSSMLLAECAERTLRGFRFPAQGAVAGRRYRLPYQLVQ